MDLAAAAGAATAAKHDYNDVSCCSGLHADKPLSSALFAPGILSLAGKHPIAVVGEAAASPSRPSTEATAGSSSATSLRSLSCATKNSSSSAMAVAVPAAGGQYSAGRSQMATPASVCSTVTTTTEAATHSADRKDLGNNSELSISSETASSTSSHNEVAAQTTVEPHVVDAPVTDNCCHSSASTAAAASPVVEKAMEAVLQASASVPDDAITVQGIDFEKSRNLDDLLSSFLTMGFQATQLGRAIAEVNRMLACRYPADMCQDSADTKGETTAAESSQCRCSGAACNSSSRAKKRCAIWLAFTSNMMSSGLRDVFRFLCKYELVDVVVTSAGGVEEDFVKALAPTIVGDFSLNGKLLRQRGWNRIGNLLVPNSNYCMFEDWLQPILNKMLQEQQQRLLLLLLQRGRELRREAAAQKELARMQLLLQSRREAKLMQKQHKQGESQEFQPSQPEGLLQKEQSQQKQNYESEDLVLNEDADEGEACWQAVYREYRSNFMSRKIDNSSSTSNNHSSNKDNINTDKSESNSNCSRGEGSSAVETKWCPNLAEAAWSPSEIVHRLGKEINREDSVFYWCAKNNIPVFCPGLTDGALGDNLFFHAVKQEGLIVDIVKDVRAVCERVMKSEKSAMLILGGGLPKHHVCNAHLMRNGADFAVYVNTGTEFDGSDSGASPDEAVSWGKIRTDAHPVKVHGDATVFFSLIVAATFAKYFHQKKAANAESAAAECSRAK